MSKELVKVWSIERWSELIRKLAADFTIVQLGDQTEPVYSGVLAFGGRLTKRESMALLSLASLHIGPDSFLMHAANGLDVPSVIIYGGARPTGCFGYAANENLSVPIECGPCWLHTSIGDKCPFGMECMQRISVDDVLVACHRLLERQSGSSPSCPSSAASRRAA